MSLIKRNKFYKPFFYFIAILIAVLSLIYTNNLVEKLSIEERKKIELWAEGIKHFNLNPEQDVSLISKILENNETIPAVITDENFKIVEHNNIDVPKKDSEAFLKKYFDKIKNDNPPIEIQLISGKNYIYYSDSIILTRLFYFPFIQLSVIFLFIVIAFLAFSYTKRAEQNKVWVGMSKETAHQLGTPISSLSGWIEVLRMKNVDETIVNEIEKDVSRLETVTDRFSKIGSNPKLLEQDILLIFDNFVEYIKKRLSSGIKVTIEKPSEEIILKINKSLFEWVVENICKNAADSIKSNKGYIKIEIKESDTDVIIDISDSGKGILKKDFKNVFKPGFTTKKRGWGLGLSLAKRIIEEYHKGKLFVKKSDIGVGTTMRIVLNKHF